MDPIAEAFEAFLALASEMPGGLEIVMDPECGNRAYAVGELLALMGICLDSVRQEMDAQLAKSRGR